MRPGTDSLNVAVAAGILLYHVMRRAMAVIQRRRPHENAYNQLSPNTPLARGL